MIGIGLAILSVFTIFLIFYDLLRNKKPKKSIKNIPIIPEERILTPEQKVIFDALWEKGRQEVWDNRYATSPCPVQTTKNGK